MIKLALSLSEPLLGSIFSCLSFDDLWSLVGLISFSLCIYPILNSSSLTLEFSIIPPGDPIIIFWILSIFLWYSSYLLLILAISSSCLLLSSPLVLYSSLSNLSSSLSFWLSAAWPLASAASLRESSVFKALNKCRLSSIYRVSRVFRSTSWDLLFCEVSNRDGVCGVVRRIGAPGFVESRMLWDCIC